MQLTIIDTEYVRPDIHISKENLEKYKNGDTFIETGTYHGDTVSMVLKTNLFKTIHTIELDKQLYDNAVENFSKNTEVVCHQGDSIDCLKEIVSKLEGPATFWLDAHASGPLPGGKSGGSPVLDELDIIAATGRNDHTIIIDDCRLFGSAEWSFVTKEDAVERIKKINPNYNIHYLDGHERNDVLWATVK
jgi:hypothetical protein